MPAARSSLPLPAYCSTPLREEHGKDSAISEHAQRTQRRPSVCPVLKRIRGFSCRVERGTTGVTCPRTAAPDPWASFPTRCTLAAPLLLPSYSLDSSLSTTFFDTYAPTHFLRQPASLLPPTRLCRPRPRSIESRATLARDRLPLSTLPALPEHAEPLCLLFVLQYELVGTLARRVCSGKQRTAAAREGCLAHSRRQGGKGH